MPAADVAVAQELYAQHTAVRPLVERIRAVADDLGTTAADLTPVRDLVDRLDTELLPHERAEEEQLLPIVARALGGPDPVGALSRTHAEIEHQIRRLRRALPDPGERPEPEDVVDLRAGLYGLYAVMQLHNAQEEENAFSLMPAGR
ncbi:hemerythrin domain-containing protein [Dactylosporangium sp. AC04546]|uniref:hemerythrin domain-containing protein n=1 Tax=Dactylosporangium sp. AC04546 TaxID=2862460 RepID=UPI003FA494C8